MKRIVLEEQLDISDYTQFILIEPSGKLRLIEKDSHDYPYRLDKGRYQNLLNLHNYWSNSNIYIIKDNKLLDITENIKSSTFKKENAINISAINLSKGIVVYLDKEFYGFVWTKDEERTYTLQSVNSTKCCGVYSSFRLLMQAYSNLTFYQLD